MMKNLCIITLLLFSAYFTQAQIVDIPDANFKNALVNTNCVDINGDGFGDFDADTNDDGEIQVSEAEDVYWLDINQENISSIEGIQSFTSLRGLWCNDNQLTNIDMSQNTDLDKLYCRNNQITSIDVTQNTSLKYFQCGRNNLTNLNVSQNPELERFYCHENQLANIDVTQNSNLRWFWCYDNQLTNLDVTQNSTLSRLYFGDNQITEINVTQNSELETLSSFNNPLISLDVSQNSNLDTFYCENNNLSSLDVSQNPNLEWLFCSNNQLTSLDISQHSDFIGLDCSENQLNSLNIKNGNNHNMVIMFANNNPNLNCIQVDNEDYANTQSCNEFDGWCKDDWAEYSENCALGVTEEELYSISLYPNPVQNTLNISTELPIDNAQIYNLHGQLIHQSTNNQIDVSLLNTGLYFVSIQIDGKSSTKKFIKK